MARVLVINPGSTSTKVAVFDDEKEIAQENITHGNEELASFPKTSDQAPFRLKAIKDFLSKHSILEKSIECVVGRGGPLKPIPAGTYIINDAMLVDLIESKRADHPSTLGGIIADMIRKERGIPAYIVDPVSVDEFEDFVRVAGFPECERVSLGHALNIRAACRRAVKELGITPGTSRFVVAHMGGGISVVPAEAGRIADYDNAKEAGPIQPERSGWLPLASLIELCFSGKYTEDDIATMTSKKGGIYAYLGTNDVREVLDRIKKGDMKAKMVLDAMIYQISQEIGIMATTLKGKVDAIILTGSIAYSDYVVSRITDYVGYIAKVVVYGGQMEMEALAQGGLRVLRGVEKAKEY